MIRTRAFEPKVIVEVRKLQAVRPVSQTLDRKPMGRAYGSSSFAISTGSQQNSFAQRKQA